MKFILSLLVAFPVLVTAGNINPLIDKTTFQFVTPAAQQFYAAQSTNAYASNFVYQIAQLIAGGISAATATNIAAYQMRAERLAVRGEYVSRR